MTIAKRLSLLLVVPRVARLRLGLFTRLDELARLPTWWLTGRQVAESRGVRHA